MCGLARLSVRSPVSVLECMAPGADHRLSYPASAVGLAIKSSFLVFCSGVIFGLGLGVYGMLNPLKVNWLLDMFGELDPSLASGV